MSGIGEESSETKGGWGRPAAVDILFIMYSSTPSQSYTAAYPLPAAQPDPFSDGQSHAPLLSPPSGWARSASRLSAPSSVNREQKVRVLLLGEDGECSVLRCQKTPGSSGNPTQANHEHTASRVKGWSLVMGGER